MNHLRTLDFQNPEPEIDFKNIYNFPKADPSCHRCGLLVEGVEVWEPPFLGPSACCLGCMSHWGSSPPSHQISTRAFPSCVSFTQRALLPAHTQVLQRATAKRTAFTPLGKTSRRFYGSFQHNFAPGYFTNTGERPFLLWF